MIKWESGQKPDYERILDVCSEYRRQAGGKDPAAQAYKTTTEIIMLLSPSLA